MPSCACCCLKRQTLRLLLCWIMLILGNRYSANLILIFESLSFSPNSSCLRIKMFNCWLEKSKRERDTHTQSLSHLIFSFFFVRFSLFSLFCVKWILKIFISKQNRRILVIKKAIKAGNCRCYVKLAFVMNIKTINSSLFLL